MGGPQDHDGRTARLRAWLEHPGSFDPRPGADGATIYLISDRPGYPAAFRVPAGGGAPAPLPGSARRVGRVEPAPEGPRVIVATDAGGDERWELAVLERPDAPPRRVTTDPERIHAPGAWRDGRRYVFGSNERDPRFFDVYEADLDRPDPPRRLREEDALIDIVAADRDRLLLMRSTTNLDRELLLWTEGRELPLNPHSGEESIFSAELGSDAVYAASNRDREFAGLFRFGPPGSTPELLLGFDGDLETVVADRSGTRLALVENDRGWSRLSVYEIATGEVRHVTLPAPGVVGGVDWLPSGERLVFGLSASALGNRVYSTGGAAGTATELIVDEPALPGTAATPGLGRFRAEDGLEVPYWEYPAAAGPARGTIVSVHGGPEGQARPGFQPVVQFLRHEGYQVVAPNVRGSLGYGRRYVHLDDVRLRMNSVRDLRDLVRHLSAPERADGAPGARYGVIGGSYGGFMVLAALTTYPDLFDVGVDIVGIANFVTFLERTGPWRRKVREDEYGSLAHDREFLRSISPLFRAESIRVPLLVIHGANDPRVPLFEAEQIVEALRRRKVPVDLMRFEDEGHGLARRENQVVAYARAAEFFDRHLGSPG